MSVGVGVCVMSCGVTSSHLSLEGWRQGLRPAGRQAHACLEEGVQSKGVCFLPLSVRDPNQY